MSLAGKLYRAARWANTAQAIASGDPKRMRHRAKNLLLGRVLARTGVWRRLWR